MAALLLLDTSGPLSTAALSRDGVPVAAQTHDGGKDGAAVLNLLVARALHDAGLELQDVEGVSVLAGPGSYTGLRVAVAAAKGFCYALDVPLIGINRLELLALQARGSTPERTVVAAMPARPGEWFAAAYAADGLSLLPPAHQHEASLAAWIASRADACCWTGSTPPGALAGAVLPVNTNGEISLPNWSRLSETRWQHRNFESLSTFSPFYLKAPFIAEKKHI